jgi:hypothetical protein
MELLKQIEGETTMVWTGFVFEMRDAKFIPFGTTFLVAFFDIPDEYTFDDVVAVHNHSYVTKDGEVRSLKQGSMKLPSDYIRTAVRRERPYFVCYTDSWRA